MRRVAPAVLALALLAGCAEPARAPAGTGDPEAHARLEQALAASDAKAADGRLTEIATVSTISGIQVPSCQSVYIALDGDGRAKAAEVSATTGTTGAAPAIDQVCAKATTPLLDLTLLGEDMWLSSSGASAVPFTVTDDVREEIGAAYGAADREQLPTAVAVTGRDGGFAVTAADLEGLKAIAALAGADVTPLTRRGEADTASARLEITVADGVVAETRLSMETTRNGSTASVEQTTAYTYGAQDVAAPADVMPMDPLPIDNLDEALGNAVSV